MLTSPVSTSRPACRGCSSSPTTIHVAPSATGSWVIPRTLSGERRRSGARPSDVHQVDPVALDRTHLDVTEAGIGQHPPGELLSPDSAESRPAPGQRDLEAVQDAD